MRSRIVLGVTLCLGVAALAAPAPSGAEKDGSGEKVKTGVEAKLKPCCESPAPEASGEAKRITVKKNGVVRRDELSVGIEIPLPALEVDETNAAAAVVALTLRRGETAYAMCSLLLDQIETEEDEGELTSVAQYRLRVAETTTDGVHRTIKKGSCTGETVVPDVQSGDVATIAIGADVTVDILLGTFGSNGKKKH